MTSSSLRPRAPRLHNHKRPIALWGLIGITVACELTLWGADQGYWGARFWRALAYQYWAFWPGLLDDWKPNYALQPYLMWLSYAFFHGSLSHMLGNMLALFAFTGPLLARFRIRYFFIIYFGAAIGGAVAFAYFNSGFRPMVGASGALFGLISALIANDLYKARRSRAAWINALRQTLFLIAINIIMWLWLDGLLAWETHLGGALVGFALGWRKSRPSTV